MSFVCQVDEQPWNHWSWAELSWLKGLALMVIDLISTGEYFQRGALPKSWQSRNNSEDNIINTCVATVMKCLWRKS